MKLLLIIIVIWVVSFNVTLQLYGHKHIWDLDRSGLNELDKVMKSDTSDRLGLIVVTEKSWYITQSIDNKYKFIWAIVNQDGKIERASFKPGEYRTN